MDYKNQKFDIIIQGGQSNAEGSGRGPVFKAYEPSENICYLDVPKIVENVPGGVGVYWICSNLIALLQTFVLNQIYNPVKIRAQAEIEYEERRRQKQEDKKRLAEARAREQRELALQQKEEKKPTSKKKKPQENKAQTEAENPEEAGEKTAQPEE